MNWESALCLVGIAFAGICLGGAALLEWRARRDLRITREQIAEFRVTPRFNVGSDIKELREYR